MDSLSWSFDPTELVGFDLTSAVYPSGNFSANGASSPSSEAECWWRTIYRGFVLGRRARDRAEARTINGDGWTLALNPGWLLAPDPVRKGSFVAVRR